MQDFLLLDCPIDVFKNLYIHLSDTSKYNYFSLTHISKNKNLLFAREMRTLAHMSHLCAYFLLCSYVKTKFFFTYNVSFLQGKVRF